jgi:hypothetical protein
MESMPSGRGRENAPDLDWWTVAEVGVEEGLQVDRKESRWESEDVIDVNKLAYVHT